HIPSRGQRRRGRAPSVGPRRPGRGPYGEQARRLSGPPRRTLRRDGSGRARTLARDRCRWRQRDCNRCDPRRVDGLFAMIGQKEAESAFLEAWAAGRLHHAWLLAGPQGMGKAAFAGRAARFLVTHGKENEEGAPLTFADPGDTAAGRLVDAGNHPEILTLARAPKEKSKELAR